MEDAVRLTPSPREKLWGRTGLSPWFADSAAPIGEVWYLAERELPLLVKLLFTSERLSVQVHPADGEDGPRGKTEMWHILEAASDAVIALGFREPVRHEHLRSAAFSGEIERVLNWMPVRAGQSFFTPAHTVHAIGAGVVLCEIQQNSDVTYRLWDYGRPRPLHLEQALRVADLGVHPGPLQPVQLGAGHEGLVRCPQFVVESLRLSPGEAYAPPPQPCHLWICLEGCGAISGRPYRPGEVWLLPEGRPQTAVRAETPSRWLRAFVPS